MKFMKEEINKNKYNKQYIRSYIIQFGRNYEVCDGWL